MKTYLSIVLLFSISYITSAQQEVLKSLGGNPVLDKYREAELKQPSQALGKAAANLPRNFPITEHFAGTTPDTLFWLSENVSVSEKTARFNAQTIQGTTYSNGDGTYGAGDVLTSKAINALAIPDYCYINFDYESGATWQTGDSLVLQAMNAAGNWDNIWSSAPISITKRNVSFSQPLGLLYGHASFQLRFICYTTRSAANTETFRLFHVVFGLKQSLPFYDNIFWDTLHTSRRTWSKMQGTRDSSATISWGRVIRLDNLDESGIPYNNGSNDTIQSYSYDFSGLRPSDSVFFRFYYRAHINQSTDSLVVQFKNNGGLWIDQLAVSAAQSASWQRYIVNVNRSRFNHADFQFRVIARGSTPADTLWTVSGFNIGKRLNLPFREDFATTEVYPDARHWTDRLVFVNANYPLSPPGINAATFDGLDRLGVPYGIGKGYCDTLTSLPFRLDQVTEADSVYLSFWIQPKGLGEAPENADSLLLEFRSTAASPDSFMQVWGTTPQGLLTSMFTEVRILLPSRYFHDDLQLRFRNKGSRNGSFNHWHLDYIYLDKDRRRNDVISDVALQEFPSPLLQKYLSVPYSHFKLNPSAFFANEQTFTARNNSLGNYAVNYRRVVLDQQNDTIDRFDNIFNSFLAQTTDTGYVTSKPNVTNHFNTDSAVLRCRFSIVVGTTVDRIPDNDTLWQSTYLGNYYAYDDGTAERTYSIQFGPGKAALRYTFNQPDTLYGISVFYGRGLNDISDRPFELKVWSGLNPENTLLSIPARAIYYNARNGFHYVKFETPVFVQNTVYIGWEQTETFDLNVGMDMNFKTNGKYDPNPEMFYDAGGTGWTNTQLPGALMMRPIVGKWIDPPPVGLPKNHKAVLDAVVFPNPTSGSIIIQSGSAAPLNVKIFDITGKEVMRTVSAGQHIDLGHLVGGLYFVQVEDSQTRASKTSKLLLTR